MSNILKNRCALVTGSSQGLGKAIALAYLRAGANVMLCARNEAPLEATTAELSSIAATDQKIRSFVCDVSVPIEVTALFDTALREFGSLDILVNNAAIQGPIGCMEELDWADWARTIEVNLLGPALCCHTAIPIFKKNNRGKIINLSGAGATSPRPRFSAYASAKAAVVRLTETLAVELQPHAVDVNAVAPGAMNTRLLDALLATNPENSGAEYAQALRQRDSGGFPPETAAELCVFLASSRSDGITGKLISAPWDPWQDLGKHRDELAASDIYTLRRITPEDRGKKWK